MLNFQKIYKKSIKKPINKNNYKNIKYKKMLEYNMTLPNIYIFFSELTNSLSHGGHVGIQDGGKPFGQKSWIRQFLNSAHKNTPRCKFSHFLPEVNNFFTYFSHY